MQKIDLVNKQFGKLIVIRQWGKNNQGNLRWICQCECGNQKIVIGNDIKAGKTKSCGCSKNVGHIKHGQSKKGKWSPEYSAWTSMVGRCKEKYNFSKNYYYRGITVCDRWLGKIGFVNFLEDMGKKPNKILSLDRIDNDKGYYKENCRWASISVQSKNKSSTVNIEYKGVTMCLTDWSRKFGFCTSTIYKKLKSNRLSIEQIFKEYEDKVA